jgi:MFS transporter, BCD family, chlorophyll transporter
MRLRSQQNSQKSSRKGSCVIGLAPMSSPTNLEGLEASSKSTDLPRIRLLTMFRLGLFQMGLGTMSILTLGVLNRILIDQNLLGIPATVAGGALAMYQLIAPARVMFGQMSDSKTIFGYHRTGYVWIGSALFALCSFLAVQVIWQLSNNLGLMEPSRGAWAWTPASIGWVGLMALMFALYGLCISCSSTPFAALLVDISDEDDRPKLVGIVWSMLMVGIVLGAVVSGRLLNGVTLETLQDTINRLFMIVPGTVFLLGLIATFGVEKKYSRYSSRSILADREDKITLGTALKVLTASRQTGIFFSFLMVMTMSLFMQQPILEPYAGEVFGMTVSQSTQLNAFWGTGTLIGMAVTGFLIVPRLGKQRTAAIGCLSVAFCFGLVLLAGFTKSQTLLQATMVILGFGFGVTTNAAVSLMLDLTAPETAGTFIGAWGLAQAMSQALATLAGGALLDVGRSLFTEPVLAFGLVFVLEAVGLVLAVFMLRRVNVVEFRTNTRQAISQVLAQGLD